MVEPRPTPVDTPDRTPRNRVLHYVALTLVVIVLVAAAVAIAG